MSLHMSLRAVCPSCASLRGMPKDSRSIKSRSCSSFVRAQKSDAGSQDKRMAAGRRGLLLSSLLVPAGLAALEVLQPASALAAEAQRPAILFTDVQNPDEPTRPDGLTVATFAGGCFWCMEGPFDKVDGVVATTSGYTGGRDPAPTYKSVSSGFTGHAEAMEVLYDPAKVSYAQLLDIFWHQINPTTANQQFCDRGNQYRSAIFVANSGQERLAKESLQKFQDSGVFGKGRQLVTEIVPLSQFYPAEDYHQDYYRKNPELYRYYRTRCGRDDYLRQVWGADADTEEAGSVIPPPALLGKYAAVLGGAWLGGGLVARLIRSARRSS